MILSAGLVLITVGALQVGFEDLVSFRRTTIVLRYGRARRVSMRTLIPLLILCAASTLVLLASPAINVDYQPLGLGCLAILLALRARVSRNVDGSDRMLLLVTATAFAFVTLDRTSPELAHWPYITMLMLLGIAYFDSGFAKATVSSWRNGRELALILNLKEFGNKHVARILLATPKLAWLTSWSVIVLEMSAGVLLAIGGCVAMFTAVLLALMHLAMAFTMGLGRFVYPFIGGVALVIGAQQL